MTQPNRAARRFLRIREVVAKVGLSKSQVNDLERRGEFPKRVKISSHCSAHLEHEVDEWIELRVAASRTKAAAAERKNEHASRAPSGRIQRAADRRAL